MTGFKWLLGVPIALLANPASAQDRANDNAVTAAGDAFGLTVGQETLGIYSANSARGFSPTEAGNVRLEGLYFDPAYDLSSLIVASTTLKVGPSAQGYAFAAPSGIVDISLRRPVAGAGASLLATADSFGSRGIEIGASFPLGDRFALAGGARSTSLHYWDGSSALTRSAALTGRWRPSSGVEVIPFWSYTHDSDDEASPYYLPAGQQLPPQPKPRQFDGPDWADHRWTASSQGVVANVTSFKEWTFQFGAFRSVYDVMENYSNFLRDVRQDGSAQRILIAFPHSKRVALSGEIRIARSFVEGPRYHRLQLSFRTKSGSRTFGGGDKIDLGQTRIGSRLEMKKPVFDFGPLSRAQLRQSAVGLSYDFRWKGRGQAAMSVSSVNYRKTTSVPGNLLAITRAHPLIYNANAAVQITRSLSAYAGTARGLEESGVAPPTAVNGGQQLPAILTTQRDAGVTIALSPKLTAVLGVFELERPYFSADATNTYVQVGVVRSRGAEFSIAGAITSRLNVVFGGNFIDARVIQKTAPTVLTGRDASGIPRKTLSFDMNWRSILLVGLSLDASVAQRGAFFASTDNRLVVPSRTQLSLGARYQFSLAGQRATLRIQGQNILDRRSFKVTGQGTLVPEPGRSVLARLGIDL